MMAIGNIFYEIVSYYIKYFKKISSDGTITIFVCRMSHNLILYAVLGFNKFYLFTKVFIPYLRKEISFVESKKKKESCKSFSFTMKIFFK